MKIIAVNIALRKSTDKNSSMVFRSLLLFPFFLFASLNSSFASDIQLTLSQQSVDEHVTVVINNDSSEDVAINAVFIEFNHQKYRQPSRLKIPAGENRSFPFKVKSPAVPGSYPLIAIVSYLNYGQLLSIKNVGLFHYINPAPLDVSCFLQKTTLEKEGDIIIKSSQPEIWDLILPDEIEIKSTSIAGDRKIFHVCSKVSGFQNKYNYFAVAQEEILGRHKSIFYNSTLITGKINNEKDSSNRGQIPSNILLIISFLFLVYNFFMGKMGKVKSRFSIAMIKFTSRMFILTISYYILKNIDTWIEYSLLYIHFDSYQYIAKIVIDNFRGSNYFYFFNYFIDYYIFACLLLTFPYLYWFNTESKINEDKYFSLVESFLSLIAFAKTKKIIWNNHSKLGLLTVGVKIFYIPYLTSWVINNTIHQKNLTGGLLWDIELINEYLVALFIYVDTIIFCTGYLTESKYLKNEIKSVEPTLLGWIVCLWCYPPFNAFSFKIFDYHFIYIKELPANIHTILLCIITVLWGVFAWASFSLGFKASNLTNRGIIDTGPYRFVRHPAYSAKLMVWIIQALFFGFYSIGILIGFIMIYGLRAWTEERHLSKDMAYIDYKKRVPWMIFPKLF